MDSTNLKIVCYTGGTCGDLITAMIDPRDTAFRDQAVRHDTQRQRLKKPLSFANDSEKDDFIQQIQQQYASIPSHDLEYHVRRGHKFISVIVQDFDTARWAADRFKRLHRPQVWDEMQRACGATTVDDYANMLIDYSNMVKRHTDLVIHLESIVQGQAVPAVESILGYKLDKPGHNIYQNWLWLQKGYV